MKTNTSNPGFEASSVVILLNISEVQQHWADVKMAAKILIDHLKEGDVFCLITYNAESLRISPKIRIESESPNILVGSQKENLKSELIDDSETNKKVAAAGSYADDIKQVIGDLYSDSAIFLISDAIADEEKILDALIDVDFPVFVLGIGEHNPYFDDLKGLADKTGGQSLFTGPDVNLYKLEKFVLQSMKHIFGSNVIVASSGILFPGSERKIPFRIAETDDWQDVTLLSSDNQQLDFFLQSPGGDVIKPEDVEKFEPLTFYRDQNHAFFRLAGPITVKENRPTWAGRWRILLESKANHDVEYYLMVDSHSQFAFRAQAIQEENSRTVQIIGAFKGIEEVEYLSVQGEMKTPTGQDVVIDFHANEQGTYEALCEDLGAGHYDVDLKVRGINLMGSTFRQEEYVTFSVK